MSDPITDTTQPAAQPIGYQQAPVPPPPATDIRPDNIGNLLTEQYSQSFAYHNELLKTKAEHDRYRSENDIKLQANAEKVQAYDALSAETAQYREFTAAVLKVKYEALDKEFLSAYADELKLEDLLKNPLAGIAAIDKNLKIFNGVIAKYKASKPDGTQGSPSTAPSENNAVLSRAEWIARSQEFLKNNG
jgi:hypothetical protein